MGIWALPGNPMCALESSTNILDYTTIKENAGLIQVVSLNGNIDHGWKEKHQLKNTSTAENLRMRIIEEHNNFQVCKWKQVPVNALQNSFPFFAF